MLVYSLYACNACQLWMNFKVIFCWYMVIILCISILLYLWFSSYLAYECIPFCHQTLQPGKPFKTLNPSFGWLNIWDCVGLFLCSLETISGTKTSHGNLLSKTYSWPHRGWDEKKINIIYYIIYQHSKTFCLSQKLFPDYKETSQHNLKYSIKQN